MNKVALVTGGSRGIGLGISKRLVSDGFHVSVVGTKAPQAFFSDEIENHELFYIQGDISNDEDRAMIVEQVINKFGRIDLLVNNAGVAPHERADILEMKEESWDRVLGINLKGTMFLTQAVVKQMLTQPCIYAKKGTIINISSISSYTSSTNRGEYCISKAGISMLTTLYADRLAKESIFVHEIQPGIIQTDMTSNVRNKYDELIENNLLPIARWGAVEDVANAVSVFASDSFLYTTGNTIEIDGGFHIRRL